MNWPVMVPFEIDGRLHLYYGAIPGLHGDIYSQTPHLYFPQGGVLCRASWDMGRFYALVNARGGGLPHAYVTTKPTKITGKTLQINAATLSGGEVLAELLDDQRSPIPGFAEADCRPFRGDEKFAAISWRGGSVPARDVVRIRFYISSAKLYGYAWS